MINTKTDFFSVTGKSEENLSSVIESITSAAQPGVVYSEPMTSGTYTVITASAVIVSGAFGSGSSVGPQEKKANEDASQSPSIRSGGGGIGGGGSSSGRPVAIIVIGPDGVTVKPIFDFTKIILAGITAWGTMPMLLREMYRGKKR